MSVNNQSFIIKHGLILILLGLVGGFLFTFSLLGVISLSPLPFDIDYQLPGDSNRWKAVHLGNLLNGMMGLIFALLLNHLDLTRKKERFVALGTVGTMWGNFAFYAFAVFAPNRGLSVGSNSLGEGNWASMLAFGPAFIFGVILIAVVITMISGTPKVKL